MYINKIYCYSANNVTSTWTLLQKPPNTQTQQKFMKVCGVSVFRPKNQA